MIITSKKDRHTYQTAGQISTEILSQIKAATKPGISPLELDNLATKLCHKHQVKPAFVGVHNGLSTYQHAMCISVNDTVVHGIPTDEPVKPGDIVKLDFGIIYRGFFTDHCVTVGIEKLSPLDERLVRTTKKAVLAAVDLAVEGNPTGYLGSTMHTIAKNEGFDVLKNFIGHGIGTSLHEFPEVPAHGNPLHGSLLKTGMVICVEAQVVTGTDQTITQADGWTVTTADGGKSAMFEYQVIVGKQKPTILTPTASWPIIA